ncbi:MAG TPA: OadG family protein [Woeseiaceae bacterium]|nr:OadG family protein [Woeseiaceae bacterium]
MSLLQQGFVLMLIGMGTVFAFLTLLVAAMNLMARAVARLPTAPARGGPRGDDDAAQTAAIAAALHQHRRRHRHHRSS